MSLPSSRSAHADGRVDASIALARALPVDTRGGTIGEHVSTLSASVALTLVYMMSLAPAARAGRSVTTSVEQFDIIVVVVVAAEQLIAAAASEQRVDAVAAVDVSATAVPDRKSLPSSPMSVCATVA